MRNSCGWIKSQLTNKNKKYWTKIFT